MNVEDYIVKIANSKRNNNNPIIIALAGAGRIGKTTFTHKLQERFGISICEIVHLDGYMMDKKSAGNLTGYNPKRSNLTNASNDLNGLVYHKQSFDLPVYNHETHKHDSNKTVNPLQIIIIDGCLSLQDELLDFVDIGIFLDASEEVQTTLRQRYEQDEPGFSKEKFKQRVESYINDYREYIFPTKKRADIILKTNTDYNLSLEK
jgi:uridine kinase